MLRRIKMPIRMREGLLKNALVYVLFMVCKCFIVSVYVTWLQNLKNEVGSKTLNHILLCDCCNIIGKDYYSFLLEISIIRIECYLCRFRQFDNERMKIKMIMLRSRNFLYLCIFYLSCKFQ